MGLGDFFRGIVAQVNPFDNGKTYGTYNPPKKRDDQFGNAPSAAPAPAPSSAPSPSIQIKPQSPQNLFAGLQGNMQLPHAPNTNTLINPANSINTAPAPAPGTIITPHPATPAPGAAPKPGFTPPTPGTHAVVAGTPGTYVDHGFIPDNQPKKTGFWGHVGNALKIGGQTAVGSVENLPEVGLAAGRAATGIVQGVGQVPHIATAATATATKALADNFNNSVTRQINRGAQDVNTGIKTATHYAIDDPLNPINRNLDAAARGYQHIAPGDAGGANVYRYTQIPINVLAGLVTGGASAGAEGAAGAGEVGSNAGRIATIVNKFHDLLNTPLTSNTDNAVSRTAQAVSSRTAPAVNAVNSPIRTFSNGVSRLLGRNAPAVNDVVDTGEGINAAEGLSQPTQIPVTNGTPGSTPIPVNRPQPPLIQDVNGFDVPPNRTPPGAEPTPSTPTPVVPTPTGRPIIEVGGDRPGQVRIPTPGEIATQRATDRFNAQPAGRPDPGIEGVNRVPGEKPYQMTNDAAANSQEDVIKSYATMLKDMGQGNGTQLVPDGEGGYYRTTNNVRSAENSGKRMTNQDWRDQAEADLTSGKAEPSHQQAFNDASDPEVQSLLAQGDRTAEPPVGRPIKVKEVKGIDVRDESTVPTGMVDEPGKVRVSTESAPAKAKAEAIANSPSVYQAVNPTTGEKVYKTIPANEFEKAKAAIDGADGIAGKRQPNGFVAHITAGDPAKMEAAGFKNAGTYDHATDGVESAAHPASTPTVKEPAALPADVQKVLDNPRQFNKVQVAAARNQRKLARAVATAKEGTADAISRMDSATPAATSDAGHVPTGQFDTSANGGAYQTASRAAERSQAATEASQISPADAIKTARASQAENGAFNRRDIRNIRALFDAKRITKGTPEYNEARQILKEDGTLSAQALALRGGNTIRRTASPTELMNQFETKIYRLANDPSKIDSKVFDDVEAATTKFTDARDAATQAYNRFTEAPTTQNAKVYHAAQDMAEKADKEAKITEFNAANKLLKGNKDAAQVRELQKMSQSADLYQMDGVDASMLSGTGTFARNFVNSAVGGGEEGLFGGIASRIAGKLTGENIGGGFGRGTASGFGKGVGNIVDASKARASNAGWNPLEHLKNWATTGNQLGDSVIDSQVTHNVLDHYTQMLKDQGYKGSELRNRAGVMARQDPEDVGKVYAGYARASAGLGSGISRSSTVEGVIRDGISKALSGGNPNQVSDVASKLLTRMTVGFPTAVGRTIVEGAKRATFGVPTALRVFSSAARNDPAVRAQIIKEAIKQAGSGATTSAIFYGLGQQGLVTGSYPSDPAERARWQREGITENSIKIGDNYYQLPSYLGSAALPALFAATLGRNNGDVAKSAGEVAKGLPAILPTDQASNVLDWINGKTNSGKFLTQTAASATRALTPAGALLNQIAKSFDPTANDTTSGDAIHNFLDKVLTGIPGENKFANIPDKVDDAGNPIHNPGALPLAFGASSTTQDKGVQQTNKINDATNTDLKTLSDAGAFNDPNIKAVVGADDKAQKIYTKITSGKQATPAELKTLRAAMAKGVPTNGDDTAYLEKGQYDSNLTALNVKRAEMAADPTTKPSDLAKMDLSIKRGQVYRDNKIPYSDITDYKTTSLSDWRSMGDDTSDKYDPATYQKLWQMDQLMTKAGASDNTKDPTSAKFSAKAPGKGRSGSGVAGGWSAGFGTLKAGTGAPNVQNYQTISQSAGAVPIIQAQQPNIVHRISSTG